jgi:tRNA-dihydrouridine synthase A
MMDWTDRHCRVFHRRLSRHALLYTEMVTADAVIFGPRGRLLGFSPEEHPIALQLGGSDPAKLAKAAAIGADYGYDGVNLNVGCPSDRVQEGRFGACLMAEPRLVADCIAAMRAAVPPSVAVTVKCRIGIDDQDSEADFERFVLTVAATGCATFVVHARKAWLKGLSPKENREVPPLDYARVFRLKAAHPHLTIVLNGGIATLDEAEAHLPHVDGVMLGRAAYQTPWLLAEVDRRVFGSGEPPPTRRAVLEGMIPYIEAHLASSHIEGANSNTGRLNNICRHMLGIYHGQPGARAFRRHISEHGPGAKAGIGVLREAIELAERGAERMRADRRVA